MISNFHAIVFEHHQFLFQLNQLFYTIIVIVRSLRRRRIDSRRKRNDRNSLKDCVFRGDLEATFTLRQWRTKFQSAMG